MKKIWLLAGILVSLGMISLIWRWHIAQQSVTSLAVVPSHVSSSSGTIRYEQRTLSNSLVHIVWIPASSRFFVTPALSNQVKPIEDFSKISRSSIILNGGFFDPVNQKSTSYVVLQGNLVADPRKNERLINNPSLKPYLTKILNRSEFRRYLCGQTIRYDITFHSKPAITGCKLIDALGGGPSLLPKLTLVQEGFVDKANGKDALGSQQPNARSAIGITHNGSIVLVMIAQKSGSSGSGMSLSTLVDFMNTLGVDKAMNLDGGSSSSLYCKGKSFYGKVDLKGNYVQRPVKSVLLVQESRK